MEELKTVVVQRNRETEQAAQTAGDVACEAAADSTADAGVGMAQPDNSFNMAETGVREDDNE